MSIQTCCRDQRKMGQVIDQIKMLANNLDELRSEIDALKTNCTKKDDDLSQQMGTTKDNVLRKFKRYMRKMTSIHSLKNGRKSDCHETYYPCANPDHPMPSFLNYMLRIGKREDVWQIPTRVKYLKHESNQTDEVFEDRLENLENRSHFAKRGITQPNRKILPKEYVATSPQFSDISCELDSRVEPPLSSLINLPSNLSPTQMEVNSNFPLPNIETFSPNNTDKRFTAASTQTSTGKLKKRQKISTFRSNYPNLYFSKIKKIIKNSNESTFMICGNDYPFLKKKFYGYYPYDKEKRNNYTRKVVKKYSLDKIIEKLRAISTTNDNIVQEGHGSSSSSMSLDLELNISDSSSRIDEFSERRRPRTYIVRKKSQKRDQNNWNHFEKSIMYVEPTSDLTLFSSSFSN